MDAGSLGEVAASAGRARSGLGSAFAWWGLDSSLRRAEVGTVGRASAKPAARRAAHWVVDVTTTDPRSHLTALQRAMGKVPHRQGPLPAVEWSH